jgi:F-type H+-transporting ATPase subunit delta
MLKQVQHDAAYITSMKSLSCIAANQMLGAPRQREGAHASYRPSSKHLQSVQGQSYVDNSGGISASLAGRYATALFTLAQEQNAVAAVEASLAKVATALGESDDLRALTHSPVLSRTDAKSAIAAVAKSMKLDTLTANTLGVLAENRRLAETAAVARAFNTLAANRRGEVSAEVTSAHALTPAQTTAIATQLKKRMGTDVAIQSKVDPTILGGLTVKIGSQMIDSSIKTHLNTLAQAMKG